MGMSKEEIEAYINNVDVNNNGVSDKKEIKSFFIKCWEWIKTHKVAVFLVVLIIALLAGFGSQSKIQNAVANKVQEVKQVAIQDSNQVCFNLEAMDINKKRPYVLSTSKKSGKEIFGVNRYIETPNNKVTNSMYLTIFENVDSLDKNKPHFNKMIEQETKTAASLSK